ncbi:transcriptional enhancer factor TEF-5 [Hylobates moloch]|uniref:transcriptional enhancer factor TEF-5 n=1 Tax=Hylobates moloch TaxID=81572 RepID=UPI002675894A|nr:transcriptional enhancer factor TEF-5 [Hylobates moloch]
MGDEGQAPTSPIKPRPWPSGAVVPQRVRRTRRQEASEARAGSLNPRPTPAQAPGAPASPPRARRGSYRNSAAAQRRDAPRGGPGSRGEREGPGGRGRGRKGEEIRETSHAGRTRQTGSRQGGRSRQGGAGSGAPGVGGRPASWRPPPPPRLLNTNFPSRSLPPPRSAPPAPARLIPHIPASPLPTTPLPRPPSRLPRARRSGPAGAPPRARTRLSRPAGSGPEPRATSTIASNSWNASSSPGEAREDGPEGLDKGLDNDAEGVWSPDIEQSFQEALAIYPPCGRRKIILSDEGKMYGRNELIARYIKLRTGKTRTRKQVSSHIQVLARKKVREYQVGIKDQVSKDKALQSMASMSSAQIVSASVLQNKFSPPSPLPQAVFSTSSRFWSSPPLLGQQPGPSQDIKPFAQPAYPIQPPLPPSLSSYEPLAPLPSAAASVPVWQDRTIASSRLRLLEYSAFMEVQRDPDTYSKHLFVHIGQTNPAFSDPPLEAVDVRQIYDKFPEKKGGLKELYEKGPPNAFFLVKFWADLNSTIQEGPGAFYGVSSQYSSADSMTISVSTKVCSFGKQVVEKVETEYARLENGRFVYRIHRSPMCEYMINFIHKLKHLPEKYMMNSVLENFTILQVVTSRDSQETLLVIAFVFEVSTSEHGAQHHVYKLVKD